MAQMTFLSCVYAKLKERLAGGGFLSADEFAELWKQARGHAGGVAKAEKLLAAEGDYTGCIACLVPDPDTAQALAVAGGLAPEQLHLTLALFGDTEILGPIERAEALLAVRDAAACCAPLAGEISGIGRFTNGDQDVIYASLDAPALDELRAHVCDALEAAGFIVADDHGFTPHITLALVESGMPSPIEIVAARPVRFEGLCVWFGPEHVSVPLIGMPADDASDAAELMAALGVGADGTLVPAGNRSEPDVEGTPYEYLAGEGADLADLAATGHTHRLFNRIACAEAPGWIPYLPKPGTYAHPRYGPIAITTARNARFVDHFARHIYQDRLPIDAEHETKLSGAVGWIVGMRQNADGSADAQVEWTDRGRAFFQADRFRYFSPEWYDVWEDPATRTQYQDVAIGGALTTRPFFKDPALRPLFASEQGLIVDDQGVDMDAQQFAELETKLKALEAENTALKSAGETTATQLKTASEQIAAMQAEARRQRFTALVRGTADGQPSHRWFGEVAQHLDVLDTFAQTFGEESPQFTAYVTQQQAIAAQIATSAAFRELGSDASGALPSAWAQIERKAGELRAADASLTTEQATAKVLEQNPALYRQYQAEAI